MVLISYELSKPIRKGKRGYSSGVEHLTADQEKGKAQKWKSRVTGRRGARLG